MDVNAELAALPQFPTIAETVAAVQPIASAVWTKRASKVCGTRRATH
jgi:hypothetical protein